MLMQAIAHISAVKYIEFYKKNVIWMGKWNNTVLTNHA
jgi:hypothetical protein